MRDASVNVIPDEVCCGCGACVAICEKGGVELSLNNDGYYKRKLITDKCISCGKCLFTCPMNREPERINFDQKVYVCHLKSPEDVIRSSSGGAAYAISEYFLNKGYLICGAVWSEGAKAVQHVLIRDHRELPLLRKSKYVQSYAVDAIKKLESVQKAVVFGTPCQIAGIRQLYKQKKDFIYVDFECMGPAGYRLWDKYLNYLKNRNHSGIKKVEMRNKRKSWLHYGIRVVFKDGDEYFASKFKDPFCKLYSFAHIIQNTCLECRYLNASVADIRIGDAWAYTDGFEKREIRHGLSIVMPLTDAGMDAWHDISNLFVVKGAERQRQESISDIADEDIWNLLRDDKKDINEMCRYYENVSIGRRMFRMLGNLLSYNDSIYLFIKRLYSKN